MNKILKVLAAMMLVASLPLVTSCSKQDPPMPPVVKQDDNKKPEEPKTPGETPNPGEQHEEEIHKVVFKLVAGHLHGKYTFHQDFPITGAKYIHPIQEMTMINKGGKWSIAEDSKVKRFVVQSGIAYEQIYGLWINYYDDEGKDISGEFAEGDNAREHQHFFIPKNVKPTAEGEAEADDSDPAKMFRYTYCDTTPWDMSAHGNEGRVKFTGEDDPKLGTKGNPIGLKGYFNFTKTRKSFDLNVRLMHGPKVKFDANGVAAPYYKPTAKQMQTAHWDVDLLIPVLIYMDRGDIIEEVEDGKKLEEYTALEQRSIRAMMHAWNTSFDEVMHELRRIVEGDRTHSDEGLWF